MSFRMFDKDERLLDLSKAIQHCSLCEGLSHRTRVFSKQNGNVESRVLFVAEAPGRLGADRTGIPLYGDQTGNNFEALLSNIGWKRNDIFITNAILCNPRKANGNNGTPKREQIRNCSSYLEMAINLIKPEVIVSLGSVALDALALITPHSLKLNENVGRMVDWADTRLIPLYHPGPRAVIHRAVAQQRADFMRLAKQVSPDKGLVKTRKRRLPDGKLVGLPLGQPFDQVISAIVGALGKITYFKLTKLLYLTDLTAIRRLGHTISGEIYLRQPDGPWPPRLQKAIPILDGHEITRSFAKRMPIVQPGPAPRFDVTLDDDELDVIAEVVEKYGALNNTAIKIVAYRTAPMRYILAEEAKGQDMRHKPIIYQDKTVNSS